METMRTSIETTARGRLMAQLEGIEHRLQNEVEVPPATFAGGDFLDVAQSVEQQELARLVVSRHAERVRRLRIALARLQDGEYGICSVCRASIPPKRLRALPDTMTCGACQEQLERIAVR